ncbi:hypothetical protein ACVWZD_005837 [Streptomyces sp. TE3672]
MPRRHRRPNGPPRTAHRPLPAGALREQHHRPRAPADLAGRARFPDQPAEPPCPPGQPQNPDRPADPRRRDRPRQGGRSMTTPEPARLLPQDREGAAGGHGTALHGLARPDRRQAHQAEPLAGGGRQPGHDEPGNCSARRLGQPRQPELGKQTRPGPGRADRPPPPPTARQPTRATTTPRRSRRRRHGHRGPARRERRPARSTRETVSRGDPSRSRARSAGMTSGTVPTTDGSGHGSASTFHAPVAPSICSRMRSA